MATTTASVVSSLLPTLVASAIDAFEQTGPCRQLVTTYYIDQGSITVPYWTPLSVAAMTEGVELGTPQSVTPSSNSISISKYGAHAVLTDEAVDRAAGGNVDLVAHTGASIGRALGTQVDKSIIALFDGFSHALGSGSGTTASVTMLSQALGILADNAAPGPYNMVLSGLAMNYFIYDAKYTIPAGANTLADMAPWYMGNYAGVGLYTSPNFTVESSAVKCAIFNKEAIGLAIEKDINIETSRIDGVGWKVTGTIRFGVAETQDDGGVELHYKSA